MQRRSDLGAPTERIASIEAPETHDREETVMARLLGIPIVLVIAIASQRAMALPTAFDLLFDGAEVGGFTVDPSLATPAGLSDVSVSAFDLSVEVGGFGLVSFTLADVTGGSPIRAVFLDAELASLTSAGATGTLPGGGEGFFLDLAPSVPADASMIDLENAGSYNLMLAIPPDFPDRLGSFGIAASGDPGPPIPEPSGALLFAIGIAAVACRRLRRA
jgi:hypothetical protein